MDKKSTHTDNLRTVWEHRLFLPFPWDSPHLQPQMSRKKFSNMGVSRDRKTSAGVVSLYRPDPARPTAD
jgi:hypothetical protein